MMRPQICILIVEDDLVDRMACRRLFLRDMDYEYRLLEAETGLEGLRLFKENAPDCILLDYQLPDLNGLDFLAALAAEEGDIKTPVMLLTGAESAAVAAEAMRRGARDYLGKDADRQYLALLPAAVQRMLREQRVHEEKRQAEAKFRTLVEQIQAIIYISGIGPAAMVDYISPQIQLLGFSPHAWLADPGLHARQIHPEDRQRALEEIARSRVAGTPLHCEYRLLCSDGDVKWFRDEARAVLDRHGRKLFLQGTLIDITTNKLAEAALQQSREELRRLAAHQDLIKENERKRIAQEIHDELGGLLTGIKAYVSVSMDRTIQAGGATDPLLKDAADLADTAIQAVRRVINDLRPSVLDQLGVWEALEWYASQIELRSNLTCECLVAPDIAALTLSAEQSTMLFRIVQESLTNVVRHAGASHVCIRVTRQDGVLDINIKDNGTGISNDRLLNRDSWGILGMMERARNFGGQLTITGTERQGTAVSLRLPLETQTSDLSL